MSREEIRESIEELQGLMPFTFDYCCEKCGEVLLKPEIRKFGHHIHGGAPMLAGDFKCLNDRWWKSGHTSLQIEDVGCNLTLFKDGKFYKRLWRHELKEVKSNAK